MGFPSGRLLSNFPCGKTMILTISTLLIFILFEITMAAIVATPQNSLGDDFERRNQIIDYAFSTYQYVITPREAEEILTQSYWADVDAFCSYMIAANFGEPIAGTKNVTLPSTLRIYTDEELDAIDEALWREAPTSDTNGSEHTDPTEEYVDDVEDIEMTQDDFEYAVLDEDLWDEIVFDGEYLPFYTPEVLPPYSLYDPTKYPSEFSLVAQAENPEDDPPEYSETAITPGEDALMEVDSEDAIQNTPDIDGMEDALRNTSIEEAVVEPKVCSISKLATLRNLGSRFEQKLQKSKQKLSHIISPKKLVKRVREIKKEWRQKYA
ncbi:hypothetical protein GGR52DRAFT_532758 [Hypoxylon sp. FL1284]|nr:hypothetical protein GGR52DRAFT_532758 [Hypoxylon sp. FL1284]